MFGEGGREDEVDFGAAGGPWSQGVVIAEARLPCPPERMVREAAPSDLRREDRALWRRPLQLACQRSLRPTGACPCLSFHSSSLCAIFDWVVHIQEGEKLTLHYRETSNRGDHSAWEKGGAALLTVEEMLAANFAASESP